MTEHEKTTAPHRSGPVDLEKDQISYLLSALHPSRVQKVQGMSHLEAWDVRRTLIRTFGFGGWDLTTLELSCIREKEVPAKTSGGSSRWTVAYRAQVRLTVRTADGRDLAHYEDAATGDSVNQPSYGDAHDMAMKTALSQAMKRCVTNLGDQFGLSLYRNGDVMPVVLRSTVHEVTPAQEEDPGPGATEAPAENAGTDQAWLSDIQTRIAEALTTTKLRELWQESGQAQDDGKATPQEIESLRERMKHRGEVIANRAPAESNGVVA